MICDPVVVQTLTKYFSLMFLSLQSFIFEKKKTILVV